MRAQSVRKLRQNNRDLQGSYNLQRYPSGSGTVFPWIMLQDYLGTQRFRFYLGYFDILTKFAHFIPINIKFSLEKLTSLYISEIVRLHGVPSSIVFDRDPRFTSRFWESLNKALGTKLKLSSTYHPQNDGQTERTIKLLKDLLRACVLEQKWSWESFLSLIEFTYNISFHSTIGMAFYEALSGRRCRTPLCWLEPRENITLGPEMVQQITKKVNLIQERMRAAQSRQKSYQDKRRKDLEFEVSDHVFLRVTLWTGVGRALKSQ